MSNFLSRPFPGSGKQISIPRQGRRVHTIGIGVGVRAISDLIPTSEVTKDFPLVGSTTYKDCVPGNHNVDSTDFDNYICSELRDEGLREGGWFTRVIFGPNDLGPVFPDPDAIIVDVKWRTEHMTWHPILEKLAFTSDRSTAVTITNLKGVPKSYPRIRTQYSYRPGINTPTSVREDYYLSITPFDLSSFNIADFGPKPTEVSWELDPLGRDGSIGECLHKRTVTPFITRSGGLSNLYRRIFPETNQITWQDYPIDFEVSYEEPFYVGVLHTAIAPSLTKLVKIVT